MGLLAKLHARAAAARVTPEDLGDRLAAVDALLRPLERQARREHGACETPKLADTAYGKALAEANDETLRAAALWAHRTLCTRDPWHHSPALHLVTALSRKNLRWSRREVEWALGLTLASPGEDWHLPERSRLALGAAERLGRADLEKLGDLLDALRERLSCADQIEPAVHRRLLRRLDALVGDPRRADELPPSLLLRSDPFAAAVLADLGPQLTAPGVPALLVHAASASTPNPSAKWLAEGAGLLSAAAGAPAVLKLLLERALAHKEQRQRTRWGDVEWVWVHDNSALVLRGTALLAGQLDEPWVTPLLGDLAVYAGDGSGGLANAPKDMLVANAAVAALSRRDDAVPHLARAQMRLKHRTILKGVVKGLEAAAARTGMTRSELLETAVPTHGLHESGTRTEQLGAYTAVLAAEPPGTVRLSFRKDGRTLAGVPAAVKERYAAELSELRSDAKELKKTLSTERMRVEDLLAEGRTWAYGVWARLYRDHPVVGRIVRGLLWDVRHGGDWRTGRLLDDGTLVGLGGEPLSAGGEEVRLWHPALAAADDVRAWRDALLDALIRQPFKQAFREIYLLTPAELETRDYSNRFAAHVLRAPQAQALMRTRGWTGSTLGYWDGGYDGHVAKEYVGGWRAEFFFDLIETDADNYETPSLASSDQVRFSQREGRGWAQRPLEGVPPLVFSEAMRDVDLFVGVTSIAADPSWINRGERQYEAYWRDVGFGELTESAKTRRQALERLVPRLKIADRCTLTDRFLEVRGDLRTYKIHLGSGNILMAPNDEYLCIVPSRGDKDPKVFLPFEEGGGVLSVILSKAFLLADDRDITDASIMGQINRR